MIQLNDYSTFKSLVVDRGLRFQEVEADAFYVLYATDDPIVFVYQLNKDGGPEQNDYETNLQPEANSPVSDSLESYKAIHIPTISNPVITVPVMEGVRSRILQEVIPESEEWLISSWSVSGDQPGYYEFCLADRSDETETLEDSLDTAVDWTPSGRVSSVEEETQNVTEGASALKATVDSGNAGHSGKITKDYSSSPLDISLYDTLKVAAYIQSKNTLLSCEISDGTNSFSFSYRVPSEGNYEDESFDLSLVDSVDLSSITSLSFTVKLLERTTQQDTLYLDNFRGAKGLYTETLDAAFVSDHVPFTHSFLRTIPISGTDLELHITVRNDGLDGSFAATFNGVKRPA